MTNTPESGIALNPKQYEALQTLLTDKKIDFLLYGGAAAGGKSHLGALWLFFLCINYPDIHVFLARRHKSDLLGTSIASFFYVVTLYGDHKKLWAFNKKDGTITNSRNGATIHLLATEYEPSDPHFDRFGSTQFTAGWIEEAQETPRDAFTVLSTRVGRCKNTEYGLKDIILLTCNPSRNWLYTQFYKPYISGHLPPEKKIIFASMKDNKDYLPKNYLDKMNRIEDVQQRQRLTEGIWDYDDDPQFIIPSKFLYQSLDVASEVGEVTCGIDVAMNGYQSDKTIIQLVKGNVIQSPLEITGDNFCGDPATFDTWLAQELAVFINQNKIPPNNVRIDACGVGERVYNLLRTEYKLPVYGFRGGLPPLKRPFVKTNYHNLRTQSYWELREMLRLNKLKFLNDYSELLWEELTNTKYKETDSKIALEDKTYIRRRIGRSPDYADALAMAVFKIPSQSEAKAAIATAKSDREGFNNGFHNRFANYGYERIF